MDFGLQKKRILLLIFIVGIIALSITADKCRQLAGEESSSQSGKFTIFNCFDMSSGTVACVVKEGVKLYFYNIRSAHVEKARNTAIERALLDALGQGLDAQNAAKQAQKEGVKAAKLAKWQAKRIIGPIISSGWDFFEALYYGGTLTEAFLRGTGTLVGAYAGGFLGEARLGRFGYLVGSHLGSWVGGRIGLMVYDVVNGVHYLFNLYQVRESNVLGIFDLFKVSEDSNVYEASEDYKSNSYEAPADLSSEGHEYSNSYEAPADMSAEVSEDSSSYEATSYDNSEL